MELKCKSTYHCEHKDKPVLETCYSCSLLEKIDSEKAMRFNEGKRKWSYVDFKSLEPMVQVLEFGALKYAPFNWKKPMDKMEILESLQRHLIALFAGEEVDPESGLPHIGHLMCNAMFYSYHTQKKDGRID